MLQLYIHFPFCKRKCLYCDFCSFAADESTVTGYCNALANEIKQAGRSFEGTKVDTVYIGGGTPSIVPPRLLAQVLDALHGAFSIRADAEFSSEANPGTLTPEWLEAAASGGVNRISLGMQSAQDKLLKALGRIHTFEQTREAVELTRRGGINNLNLDLMYALPGQSLPDYMQSIDAACALHPEHISAYSLILEDGTPLCAAAERGSITIPSDDEAADMSEAGTARLEAHGYRRYEISNYALIGRECRHNLGYWHGAYYLGLGLNAHGMLPPSADERSGGAVYTRVYNTEDIERYIAQNGIAQAGREVISADEAMLETMMLGLRTIGGVSESEFIGRHGKSMREQYGAALDSLASDGLGEWRDGGFRLTKRGLMLQNAAVLRLME